MMRSTIEKMLSAVDDLSVLILHGKQQAARPDADRICRLGDSAIARYETMRDDMESFINGFPSLLMSCMLSAIRGNEKIGVGSGSIVQDQWSDMEICEYLESNGIDRPKLAVEVFIGISERRITVA